MIGRSPKRVTVRKEEGAKRPLMELGDVQLIEAVHIVDVLDQLMGCEVVLVEGQVSEEGDAVHDWVLLRLWYMMAFWRRRRSSMI
jgi:hypothetical protein